MAPALRNEDLPESPQKKRKLKHPRTSRACAFCRRRKVRCSGTLPCSYCRTEGVRCEYGDDLIRPSGEAHTDAGQSSSSNAIDDNTAIPNAARDTSVNRSAPEQPSVHHIEAASGVSLLYLSQQDADRLEPIAPAALVSYGDYVPRVSNDEDDFGLPGNEELHELLGQYFRFAMPTYRCLHQPSVEQWASDVSQDDEALSNPQTACVLLACAQALLFSENGNRHGNESDARMGRSQQLYEKAKRLLNNETGPAKTASVQARIVLCLYLLSTYRLTECRYTFGNTITVLTSLGLQRKASTPSRLGLIEVESRRRTFWCAYVLDGYLSVMLGRPRLLRDQDIDQEYPRNFDDQDMASDGDPDTIPLHGNLEAFIAHADLAKLMGRNNDVLYPLDDLTEDQILLQTCEMLHLIDEWRASLPTFLRPRGKTLAGQMTFERQNTVIKLAHAHLKILASRRGLINDLNIVQYTQQQPNVAYALVAKAACMSSISTVLSVTHDLLEQGTLFQAFWFTQYVAIVAISTLYVLILQHLRGVNGCLSHSGDGFYGEPLLDAAKIVQTALAALAPAESQVGRHFKLLDLLRKKVGRELAGAEAKRSGTAARNTNSMPEPTSTSEPWWQPPVLTNPISGAAKAKNSKTVPYETIPSNPMRRVRFQDSSAQLQDPSIDDSTDLQRVDESITDAAFEDLMNWGWNDFDTLGFDSQNGWPNSQSVDS